MISRCDFVITHAKHILLLYHSRYHVYYWSAIYYLEVPVSY